MDVLKRIEQLCLDKGWTVYKLSLESGLSQSTLANMFSRRTMPSLSTLTSICDAFGITLSQFFQEWNPADVSDDEALLLKRYRLMSPDNKRILIDLSEKLI